ncbi:MAG: glycerate dehydrogenase [Chromatiaceae bacterium]|nr:MAG: glycerate dehydrogenase [Chromatiaceae bacterium]
MQRQPSDEWQAGVLLDLSSIDRGDLDLSALTRVCARWQCHDRTPPAATAERIATADLVVTNKVRLGAAEFAVAPRLRLVCIAATGTDNVDLAAAAARGIAVCNVIRYATASVIQHVFAAMLGWATRLGDQVAAVRAGRWCAAPQFCLLEQPVRELAGLTLGVVGYGELGRAVARVADCLSMRVLVAARPGSSAPHPPDRLALDVLLPQVDVLTLHCPLAANTRHLIGARELARMRPDALLINTARGGIVDEAALANALRAGHLGAAAVDTLSEEPPLPGHPLLAADIPNLMVTPHVAWASQAARQRLIGEVAANIAAFSAGIRRNRVEPASHGPDAGPAADTRG